MLWAERSNMADTEPDANKPDWWQKGRKTTSGEIKLYKSGRIGIAQSIIREHFADDQDAVVFGKHNDTLYIKPVSEGDELYRDGYSLQTSDRRSTVMVNAQSFLEYYGLVPDETTSYDYEWINEEVGIGVDLNQE